MDKLSDYRIKIKELLTKYLCYKPSNGDMEIQPIFDNENDRYQTIIMGWDDQTRIYHPMMHLDIKNNKIWIQENTTEVDLVIELMEMGVPKQDIIIGFHTQKMRELAGFAVE